MNFLAGAAGCRWLPHCPSFLPSAPAQPPQLTTSHLSRPDETAVAEQALLPVEPAAEPADPTGSARTTGEFPNLNVLPGTAAAQITPEEKAVMLGELRAKQAGVAAAAARAKPADQVQNLRKLGATHAKDALEDIEKKAE